MNTQLNAQDNRFYGNIDGNVTELNEFTEKRDDHPVSERPRHHADKWCQHHKIVSSYSIVRIDFSLYI